MTKKEMVLETLVHSLLKHLMRQPIRESITELSGSETFRL